MQNLCADRLACFRTAAMMRGQKNYRCFITSHHFEQNQNMCNYHLQQIHSYYLKTVLGSTQLLSTMYNTRVKLVRTSTRCSNYIQLLPRSTLYIYYVQRLLIPTTYKEQVQQSTTTTEYNYFVRPLTTSAMYI